MEFNKFKNAYKKTNEFKKAISLTLNEKSRLLFDNEGKRKKKEIISDFRSIIITSSIIATIGLAMFIFSMVLFSSVDDSHLISAVTVLIVSISIIALSIFLLISNLKKNNVKERYDDYLNPFTDDINRDLRHFLFDIKMIDDLDQAINFTGSYRGVEFNFIIDESKSTVFHPDNITNLTFNLPIDEKCDLLLSHLNSIYPKIHLNKENGFCLVYKDPYFQGDLLKPNQFDATKELVDYCDSLFIIIYVVLSIVYPKVLEKDDELILKISDKKGNANSKDTSIEQ